MVKQLHDIPAVYEEAGNEEDGQGQKTRASCNPTNLLQIKPKTQVHQKDERGGGTSYHNKGGTQEQMPIELVKNAWLLQVKLLKLKPMQSWLMLLLMQLTW
jgi:hypothetical protein